MWIEELLIILGVNVSLKQRNYSSNENVGFVEVCVLLDGSIERNVEIELSTINDTAKGKVLNFSESID